MFSDKNLVIFYGVLLLRFNLHNKLNFLVLEDFFSVSGLKLKVDMFWKCGWGCELGNFG